MDAEQLVAGFLQSLFCTLDREDFAAVADMLTEDVELGDELTGGWIRGRAEVSRYLLKQTGIVTGVRSELSSVAVGSPAAGLGLATFAVRQRYRLAADCRCEDLLGTVLVDLATPGNPKLRLLHLGPMRPAEVL